MRLYELGRYAEALAELDSGIRDYEQTRSQRVWILARLGRARDALEILDEHSLDMTDELLLSIDHLLVSRFLGFGPRPEAPLWIRVGCNADSRRSAVFASGVGAALLRMGELDAAEQKLSMAAGALSCPRIGARARCDLARCLAMKGALEPGFAMVTEAARVQDTRGYFGDWAEFGLPTLARLAHMRGERSLALEALQRSKDMLAGFDARTALLRVRVLETRIRGVMDSEADSVFDAVNELLTGGRYAPATPATPACWLWRIAGRSGCQDSRCLMPFILNCPQPDMTHASGGCESLPATTMLGMCASNDPPHQQGGCLAVRLPSAVVLAAAFHHPVAAGILIPASLPGAVSIIAQVRVSTWEVRNLATVSALALTCAVTWLFGLSSLFSGTPSLAVYPGCGTLAFASGMGVMLFAPVSLQRAVWTASILGIALACVAVITRHWEFLAWRLDAGGMVLAAWQSCAGMLFTHCLMKWNTRRARKSMSRIYRRRWPTCR